MGYRKYLLLFLPSFIFLVFHSYFPNKQERFILPILPFVIILGIICWNELCERKGFNVKFRKPLLYSRRFFGVLNMALLFIVSCTYSKRNRVEAMHYLAQKGDVQNLIIDNSTSDDGIFSPRFYLRKWPAEYFITGNTSVSEICPRLKSLPDSAKPNYIIFYDADKIQQRVAALQQFFDLEYETTIYPSFMDIFMHRINPVNENAVTYIYKIQNLGVKIQK
jgi:hypothetical protein